MALIHALSLTALICIGFIGTTYSEGGEGELSAKRAEIMRQFESKYGKKVKEIRQKAVENRVYCRLDLVFVVDRSGSINGTEFALMQSFMINVLTGLDLDYSQGVRVGVVTFRSQASSEFFLITHNNRPDIEAAIMALTTPSTGGTDIASGMNEACNIQFTFPNGDDRAYSPNVVIVITDGGDTSSDIVAARTCLTNAGVTTIIAVGVGDVINNVKLEEITGDSDLVFHVDNYEDLLDLVLPLCNDKRCCHSGESCEDDCDCGGKHSRGLCCDRNDPFCCCRVARRSPCHNNHCCNAGCGYGCGHGYQAPCGCNANWNTNGD